VDSDPLFSVLTVTYNRAHLLSRAVKSVLKQTYNNFELVLVDDGSTDNTESVCRGFGDDRIRYHKQVPNSGVLAARNKTLDLAAGEYIAILDDDDELVPEALQAAVDAFQRLSAKDVKIIWFNSWDTEERKRSGFGPDYREAEADVRYEDIVCGRIGNDFWQVVKRDVVGQDRFDVGLYNGEVTWWLRLHRKGTGYYVPKMLQVRYREHGGERISSVRSLLNHSSQLILTNRAIIAECGDDQRRLCPKAYGRRLAVLGAFQIMNDQKVDGRKSCREAFKYHKWPGFMGIYALSFVMSGKQIKGLALTAIRVLEKLGALRLLPIR
jgi:glycosyltransferase involved in cell wall biosynthesis